MTRVGLEWAFRLLHDPRKIGRRVFVDDPPFFGWMIRERWSRIRSRRMRARSISGRRS
jgi:UDP-N-acetyl-D-mannosaminuronic acid transferase (WecB/TagA/CpsF family)